MALTRTIRKIAPPRAPPADRGPQAARLMGHARQPNANTHLPRTLFKPFSLPLSLEGQYDAQTFRVTARMEDPEVMVRPGYLRFGFRAALLVQPR